MKNIILVSFLVSFLALQYISAAQEIKDINENNNLFWNPEAFFNPTFTGINGNSISFYTQFWKWGNRTRVIQHYNAELLSKNQKNAFGLASSQISNDYYRSVNYSASFSRTLKLKSGNELRIGSKLNYSNQSFRRFNEADSDFIHSQEFNSTLGIAFKSKNTRIGMATEFPLYYLGSEDLNRTNGQVRAFVSHNFKIGENFNIVPQAAFFVQKGYRNRVYFGADNLAVDVIYKKKLYLRLGGSAFSHTPFEVGYLINDRLKLSYSTDFNFGGYNNHNIGISLRF